MLSFRSVRAEFVLTLALALGACSEAESDPAPASLRMQEDDAPDYEHDVKSIVSTYCVSCHTADGIAPMPLETYEDVRTWATQIKRQVRARTMPPWSAGPDCNEYIGDRQLSDAQIKTISDWVDGGSARKTRARAALRKPGIAGPRGDSGAFRADVELRMPEAYTPKRTPDDYRCFVLPWPESEPTFVTGVGLHPGNRPIVHHSVVNLVKPENVQAFLDRDAADPGPGYECFTTGVSGGQVVEGEATSGSSLRSSLLGAFEKAEEGSHYPYGTGIRVEPGSAIVIQQHYNTLFAGGAAEDQSALQFMVEADVPNPATASWLVNPSWMNPMTKDTMHIAADEPDATVNVLAPASAVGRGSNRTDRNWPVPVGPRARRRARMHRVRARRRRTSAHAWDRLAADHRPDEL